MAKISPERLAALQREQVKNASNGGNFWTMKGLSKAVIRLCPIPDDVEIATKLVTFFVNNRSYICNESVHGKSGVFARAIRALSKLGTDEGNKLAELLKKQRRTSFLMKICVMNPETGTVDKGPLWYKAPKQVYLDIFNAMKDDGDDVLHPREGCNIRITKTGENLETEYSLRVLTPSPIAETKEDRAKIIDATNDMDVAAVLKADEAGGLAAIKGTIPGPIWSKIAAEVSEGIELAHDDDADAAGHAGDEDAPPAKKKPAVADDETPPAKPKKPAVSADDEDLPPAKPKKPAPPADEDAPPARKPAAVADDEDLPPAKPKPKAPAPTDDEDLPPAKPKPKAPVADDEDAPPTPPKKKPAVADDDAPAPVAPSKKGRYTED